MFKTVRKRPKGNCRLSPVHCISSSFAGSAKYHLNVHFLDNGIISHQHAWFWGIFLTDGGIHHNPQGIPSGFKWNQKYDSYPMLNALRSAMDSSHPISFSARPEFKTHYCTLAIYSMALTESIVRLMDCNPRKKTFELKFPAAVDSEFLSSLIRGIFEGDGCIAMESYTRGRMWLQITSANEHFLQCVQKCINLNCLQTHESKGSVRRQPGTCCYNLKYHSIGDCLKIGQWMYQAAHIDPHMRLAQKHSRFLLYEKLFGEKLKCEDRLPVMQKFMKEEAIKRKEVLRTLKMMSLGETFQFLSNILQSK